VVSGIGKMLHGSCIAPLEQICDKGDWRVNKIWRRSIDCFTFGHMDHASDAKLAIARIKKHPLLSSLVFLSSFRSIPTLILLTASGEFVVDQVPMQLEIGHLFPHSVATRRMMNGLEKA